MGTELFHEGGPADRRDEAKYFSQFCERTGETEAALQAKRALLIWRVCVTPQFSRTDNADLQCGCMVYIP